MTSGTNHIGYYRLAAQQDKKNMFVGARWKYHRPIGFAIWIYQPGKRRTDKDIVMEAPDLDTLYGNQHKIYPDR